MTEKAPATAACRCPGCTGGVVCEGATDCPGCISGEHGRDRRHRHLRERATAAWPDVPEHVIVDVSERGENEQRWGLTYCRRCGRAVVNDRYPENATKHPCEVVKMSLR